MASKITHRLTLRSKYTVILALVLMAVPMLVSGALSWQSARDKERPKMTANFDSVPEVKPTIPSANRNTDKRVFLEKADRMYQQQGDTFIIVTGNVEFSHGAMLMFCDSAHFFPGTESLDAFGDVRMRQGDTLFVYADELNYRGDRHIAFLYGDEKPVRMINRDVTLTTPVFIYDLYNEFGYYNEGGKLNDKQNELISQEGEYIPATKEANFYTDVVLTSLSREDTLNIYSDTLFYNTDSHIAQLVSPSTIINKDATINTSNGTYNTETMLANLYDRSRVVASTGTVLIGDTLFYDRNLGYGEAYGNMEITDSAHSMILNGDYGYYNELADSAFAMGRALAREYSQGDTLYLHGKYLYSFSIKDTVDIPEDTILGTEASTRIDTSYVMVAHPRVRFYRKDMQGLCDSMRFEQRDSQLYMHYHPVIWSGERQIFGNQIVLHLNDSTIEKATLPDFAFSAEHVEGNLYNQLAGKEMIAYFVDGDMRRLDVNGNVQAIMIPMEDDSTYNKIVNVESSFLTGDFLNREVLRMKMWPQTNGTVTPLYLAKKSLYYLPQFKWYTGMRPQYPMDVFNIPEEMEELMADIPQYEVTPPQTPHRLALIEAASLPSEEEVNDGKDDEDSSAIKEEEEDTESISEAGGEEGEGEGEETEDRRQKTV